MHIDNYSRVYNEILIWAASMPAPSMKSVYPPELDEILPKVCVELDEDIDLAYSRSRKGDVVFARQLAHAIALYFSDKNGNRWNLEGIGETIGGKDHSTVLHSAKTISNYVETKQRRSEVDLIAYQFGISSEDLLYRPETPFKYKNLMFMKKGKRMFQFDSTTEAAAFFNVETNKITKCLINRSKFDKKYNILYEVV